MDVDIAITHNVAIVSGETFSTKGHPGESIESRAYSIAESFLGDKEHEHGDREDLAQELKEAIADYEGDDGAPGFSIWE